MFTLKESSSTSICIILTSCAFSILIKLSNSIPLNSYNYHKAHENQFDQAPPLESRKSQAYQHERFAESHMTLRKLSSIGNNVTCNDGSQAGYYMRLNSKSTSWVIYLQGGGLCDSEESCLQRWRTNPHLMSSNFWSKTKKGEGILSEEPKENPHLWNANHIFVPYCSSDSWTGLSSENQRELGGENVGSSFTFMGSKILEQVFESLYDDLPQDSGLYQAKYILLAGDSAGALGVLLNLDRMNELIQRRAQTMTVNCSTFNDQIICQSRQPPVLGGIADSGWFLDNEPFQFGQERSISFGERDTYGGTFECDGIKCTPLQSMRQAIRFWNGQIPVACANQYQAEPWRCYFGYHAYKTVRTPIFIVQWLYDEAQLIVDNIGRPSSADQWTYVNKVANEMRASLVNVTALFAPSCFSHSLIGKSIWNQISINGFKLPQLLSDWEEQLITAASPKFNQLDSYHVSTDDTSSYKRQQTQDTLTQVYLSPFPYSNYQETQPNIDRPREYLQQYTQFNQEQRISSSNKQQQQQPTGNVNLNRTRTRKRKRVNQQQRNKQVRPKSSPGTSSYQHTPSASTQTLNLAREPNELISTFNPLEDLLPLIDSSIVAQDALVQRNNRQSNNMLTNNGRAGRSAIVDDGSSVLTNNMQDDSPVVHLTTQNIESRLDSRWILSETARNQPITSTGESSTVDSRIIRANHFRLIDTCGWPQCNRDCPTFGSEPSLGFI